MLKTFKLIPIYVLSMIISAWLIIRKITVAQDFEKTVLYHGIKYANRANTTATILAIIALIVLSSSVLLTILTIKEMRKPHRRLELLFARLEPEIRRATRGDVFALIHESERLSSTFKMHKKAPIGETIKCLDDVVLKVIEKLKAIQGRTFEGLDQAVKDLHAYSAGAKNYVDSVVDFLNSDEPDEELIERLNSFTEAFKQAAN